MSRIFLLRNEGHELRMRKMAEQILEQGLSEHAAQVRYQVKCLSTVRKWVCKLEDEKFLMAGEPSSKPKPTGVAQKLEKRAEELAKRVEELEKELGDSDLRALYFEHLLRTAEKELGIDIEKKSATR